MTESPATRVRERLNKLGVGPMPSDSPVTFRDDSRDAIVVRDLANGEVELSDDIGNAWVGDGDEVLAVLAVLSDANRGHPSEIWNLLDTVR